MGKSYGETDALAFRNQTATDVGHTRHWQSPEQPSSGARGQRSRQKHLLGPKMFPALDGPAGGPDTTFVKVPPGLGLLPLAPAPSSLRLTRKTVVGEATGRRTETEDEERDGHLAPRGAGGPPSSGGRDLPGPPAEGPSSSGGGGGVGRLGSKDARKELLVPTLPLLERAREGHIRPKSTKTRCSHYMPSCFQAQWEQLGLKRPR